MNIIINISVLITTDRYALYRKYVSNINQIFVNNISTYIYLLKYFNCYNILIVINVLLPSMPWNSFICSYDIQEKNPHDFGTKLTSHLKDYLMISFIFAMTVKCSFYMVCKYSILYIEFGDQINIDNIVKEREMSL